MKMQPSGSGMKPNSTPLWLWGISLILAFYYLISGIGWLLAIHLQMSGRLGAAAAAAEELTSFDQVVRFIQVGLVFIGSILLASMRRPVLGVFLISTVLSLMSVVWTKWSISFLSPTMLIPVCLYIAWLRKANHLRPRLRE